MNQDKLSESTQHYLIISNFSIFPRVPIVETDLQFITFSILVQGDASLFCPLVFGMYKDLITAIGLYALSCGNAIAIGINLLGNALSYFLFQARHAWGMYYVVHIYFSDPIIFATRRKDSGLLFTRLSTTTTL